MFVRFELECMLGRFELKSKYLHTTKMYLKLSSATWRPLFDLPLLVHKMVPPRRLPWEKAGARGRSRSRDLSLSYSPGEGSVSEPAETNIKIPCYWPCVRGIHRRPVDSPYKGPVVWKSFPCHDVTVNGTVQSGSVITLYTIAHQG